MSIRKADLHAWCCNLAASLMRASARIGGVENRMAALEKQAAIDRASANATDLELGATQRDFSLMKQKVTRLENDLSTHTHPAPSQTAQDEATGPSTVPPVGDYPPAAPGPLSAPGDASLGVSDQGAERLIELTREAIRDDLAHRRDASYLGRGHSQLT